VRTTEERIADAEKVGCRAVAVPIAEWRAAQSRISRLEEALRPFAAAAPEYDPPEGDDTDEAWCSRFRIGDLRRARLACEGS
jgi:hypothetical protein